jgi:Putative Actinobacterial Holin-X, holin superfamily III
MEKTFAKVEDLATTLKEYADSRMEAVKLQVAEKSSAIMANIIAGIAVAMLFVFFTIFASMALAVGLGVWIGKMWVGFLIVAFLYLVIGALVWKSRVKFIQFPMMNFFIAQLFNNEHGKD